MQATGCRNPVPRAVEFPFPWDGRRTRLDGAFVIHAQLRAELR